MPAILKEPFFLTGFAIMVGFLLIPGVLDKLGVIDIGNGLGYGIAAGLFGGPLLAVGAYRAGKK